MARTIMHADMDAFYASIEQRDRPELRSRPVAVGGKAPRGVIAAASYEARRYGIHSAMPTVRAQQLCPQLTLLPPRMARYRAVSQAVFEIFCRYSPLVEPISLDEAFIDLAGSSLLHGEPSTIGARLRSEVRRAVDLAVSVGIGPNKLVAKLASDRCKPDGLLVVAEGEVEDFLAPLDVVRLFGVGAATAATLGALGVRTVGEMARLPRDLLRRRLGVHGDQLWMLARGLDDRPVVADRLPESVGHEDTFETDVAEIDRLAIRVQDQADRVARRLRRLRCRAGTVVLKLKTAAHRIHTRRRRLVPPTDDGTALAAAIRPLLDHLIAQLGPVRLTGVTAADLVRDDQPLQLSLGEVNEAKRHRLGEVLDEITERFGPGAVVRAWTLERDAAPSKKR